MSRRQNGIRIYQIPPAGFAIDSPKRLAGRSSHRESSLSPQDRYRELAMTVAQVFGPTTTSFLLSELRSHNHHLPKRVDRLAVMDSLVNEHDLCKVQIDETTYLWNPEAWQSSEITDRVRILAPFDPLVRDRQRFSHLWGWDYRFEAYVPAIKRVRGYYTLPLLWRQNVIGWANASVDEGVLQIEFGYEKKRPREKAFRTQAEREIESLCRFLRLDEGAWRWTEI